MGRTYRHAIYGARKQKSSAEECCMQLNDMILRLTGMMYAMTQTVDAFFPETHTILQVIGQMRGLARLSPKLFVRVTWRQRFPGVFFDTDNILQRLQIKGIYLEFGLDHCDDPLFKDAIGVDLV